MRTPAGNTEGAAARSEVFAAAASAVIAGGALSRINRQARLPQVVRRTYRGAPGELACRGEILAIPQLQKVFGDGIRPALPICDEPHRFIWTDFGAGKRAIVRLRSRTATSVRAMVLVHFLRVRAIAADRLWTNRFVSVADWSALFFG